MWKSPLDGWVYLKRYSNSGVHIYLEFYPNSMKDNLLSSIVKMYIFDLQ